MEISNHEFVANTSPSDFISGIGEKKAYTWDRHQRNDYSLILTTALNLEEMGWRICIESPITGIQRSQRIPVFALKDSQALLVKPVVDPRKVNSSGLKMLELSLEVTSTFPDLNVSPVVFAYMEDFDPARRTSQAFDIWLQGDSWHI